MSDGGNIHLRTGLPLHHDGSIRRKVECVMNQVKKISSIPSDGKHCLIDYLNGEEGAEKVKNPQGSFRGPRVV
ncbi:MAG: hypothetical protein KAH57_06720 [Thermoplasmata archaeon]|nr:hypothetical protein [Thermoplasmata archaeon]